MIKSPVFVRLTEAKSSVPCRASEPVVPVWINIASIVRMDRQESRASLDWLGLEPHTVLWPIGAGHQDVGRVSESPDEIIRLAKEAAAQ